jgi:hypothetical protein
MRAALAGAAVVAAFASTAADAIAPGQIALDVQPSITRWGERIAVFGTVGNRRADQKVTIQFKGCGLYPKEFLDAAEITTREGGGWSVDWLFGRGTGAYRAVSGDAVSTEVKVQGRPSVRLRRDEDGSWSVFVTAALQFYKKRVLLQRFDRLGNWVTMRSVQLTEQYANNPYFGLPFVSSSTEDFRLRVPKRTTLRAVFPLSQARPCYLAGYSNLVRT